MLDHRVLGIERGDQQCIEAGRVAQRLEIQTHQCVGVLVGKILEIDSGFGEQDIQACLRPAVARVRRSEEHTSELQSLAYLVCRLLLEKKKKTKIPESK